MYVCMYDKGRLDRPLLVLLALGRGKRFSDSFFALLALGMGVEVFRSRW